MLVTVAKDMQETYIEFEGIIPSLLRMMHSPSIQDNNSILGNKLAIVHEIFHRSMRCTQPKWVMGALDFFNDVMAVRKVLFVLESR